jgi:hypothetical protein
MFVGQQTNVPTLAEGGDKDAQPLLTLKAN